MTHNHHNFKGEKKDCPHCREERLGTPKPTADDWDKEFMEILNTKGRMAALEFVRDYMDSQIEKARKEEREITDYDKGRKAGSVGYDQGIQRGIVMERDRIRAEVKGVKLKTASIDTLSGFDLAKIKILHILDALDKPHN